MKTIYHKFYIKTIIIFPSNLDIFIFNKYDSVMHKLSFELRLWLLLNCS